MDPESASETGMQSPRLTETQPSQKLDPLPPDEATPISLNRTLPVTGTGPPRQVRHAGWQGSQPRRSLVLPAGH